MATTTTIIVPKEYGYVIVTTVASLFVSFWHGVRVSSFRKAARLGYPKAYADSGDMAAAEDPERKKKMYLFNCAQRAHGNYLENHYGIVAATLIAGLQYPRATALLSVGWNVSRIVYALGYTRADKEGGKGRLAGSPGAYLCQLALYLMAGWTGLKMVL